MSVSLLFVPFHYILSFLPNSNVRFAPFCSVSSLFVLFCHFLFIVFNQCPFHYLLFRFITFIAMSVSLLFVPFCHFLFRFITFVSVSLLFVSISLLFVEIGISQHPSHFFLFSFITFCFYLH